MGSMRSLGWLVRSVLPALTTALASVAAAQPADVYPSRPITLVVPFGAGGSLDIPARWLAAELSPKLGQLVLELRPQLGHLAVEIHSQLGRLRPQPIEADLQALEPVPELVVQLG